MKTFDKTFGPLSLVGKSDFKEALYIRAKGSDTDICVIRNSDLEEWIMKFQILPTVSEWIVEGSIESQPNWLCLMDNISALKLMVENWTLSSGNVLFRNENKEICLYLIKNDPSFTKVKSSYADFSSLLREAAVFFIEHSQVDSWVSNLGKEAVEVLKEKYPIIKYSNDLTEITPFAWLDVYRSEGLIH